MRGVQYGVVLGGDRHQAVALCAARLERSAQSKVVGLGASAGEDDLARRRPDRRGDLLARLVDERARRAPLGVDARGVPRTVAIHARHRLGDLGVDGRGGGVVEIHASHGPKV